MPHPRAQLLVLALFACVRLVHLAQLVDSPALSQQQWPESDMFAFDAWAHNIVHGDVLSQQPQRPLTAWHREVAAAVGENPDAAWQKWLGAPRFYQEPLFAYLLAGVYALSDAPLVALAFQALLGLLGLWLLMDATRRLLGEREALVAGLLATFCGPLAFYESLLLRETLAVTTMWLLVRQWAVARGSGHARAYVGVGLAAGLALLTRVAIAPFAVLLLVCSLLPKHQRIHRLGAWALGLALPFGLLVLRNALVGAPPLAIAGGGVFAFVAANAPGADPWQGLVLDAPVIARLLQQNHGGALALALATLHEQQHLLALEFAKLGALLHNFEMPNNASFALYRQHAPVLKWLPVDFALLLPLGLVGAIVALRGPPSQTPRRARALVLLACVQLLPLLILQPLSRYRLGLLAALLPLAALAIVFLRDLWPSARPRMLAWLLVILLATAVLLRPLPPGVPPSRAVDHAVAWQFWALPAVQNAARRQDNAAVADALRLFLRGEPPDLLTWPRPLRSEQTRIAEIYSQAHALAAQAAQMQGNQAEAARENAASATLHKLNHP